MANTARQFVEEAHREGKSAILINSLSRLSDEFAGGAGEVCIHGAWLPALWRAARMAKKAGARLLIRPAGSYDPVRLSYHAWKKRLVAPFERRMLMRADVLLATCEAERDWIRSYVGLNCPKIEITDLKRFFDLSREEKGNGERGTGNCCREERVERAEEKISSHKEHKGHKEGEPLHLLYLGRRHPLKGVQYLEEAVRSLEFRVQSSELKAEPDSSQLETRNLELKIISSAFGEEKEKVWDWCDVLVLPTLSENFGRVVAEALERGKSVITTDGAPAWGKDCKCIIENVKCKNGDGEIWKGYDGRLIYLKGYREGTREERIALLKSAIGEMTKTT